MEVMEEVNNKVSFLDSKKKKYKKKNNNRLFECMYGGDWKNRQRLDNLSL